MKRLFTNREGKFSIWKLLRNVFIVGILVLAAVAGKMYSDIQLTLESVNQTVAVDNLRTNEVSIEEGEPINVLLIGTDGNDSDRSEEEGFVSRSDTLMLVNLNPHNRQTKVVSIPRDVIAHIDGVPTPDKINHAFAYGGVDLTIDTVQDFLQVPIDYYAVIDMQGLEELIDAIGGIEVTSPITFEYRGTEFKEGETREVNGVKALNFARMRYDDPQGEIGRQNRQKIVIKAIVDKLLSLEGVTSYASILSVISDNVVTNVNLETALDIYQAYLPALENVTAVQFDELEEIYIDGIFYFHIPLNARVQVANEFRYQSNLPPIAIHDLEDPIASPEIAQQTKSLTTIINQYPTGLTDEETETIMTEQEELQTIRQTEYYEPPAEQAPVYTEPAVPYIPEPDTYEPYYPPAPEDNYSDVPPVDNWYPEESTQPEQPSEVPPQSQPEPPQTQAPPQSSMGASGRSGDTSQPNE